MEAKNKKFYSFTSIVEVCEDGEIKEQDILIIGYLKNNCTINEIRFFKNISAVIFSDILFFETKKHFKIKLN